MTESIDASGSGGSFAKQSLAAANAGSFDPLGLASQPPSFLGGQAEPKSKPQSTLFSKQLVKEAPS